MVSNWFERIIKLFEINFCIQNFIANISLPQLDKNSSFTSSVVQHFSFPKYFAFLCLTCFAATDEFLFKKGTNEKNFQKISLETKNFNFTHHQRAHHATICHDCSMISCVSMVLDHCPTDHFPSNSCPDCY